MLLTTAPNAPWLLQRHRYLEECSRVTSRIAVFVLVATLVLFSVGLVNVAEVPRRGDAAHNGRPRTRASFFTRAWSRNSSAEPQGANHWLARSQPPRPLPLGGAGATPAASPPPRPPYPRSPPLRLLQTPTVISECAHTLRPLEMAHEPPYPGRRHWRAYAEWSGLDEASRGEGDSYGDSYGSYGGGGGDSGWEDDDDITAPGRGAQRESPPLSGAGRLPPPAAVRGGVPALAGKVQLRTVRPVVDHGCAWPVMATHGRSRPNTASTPPARPQHAPPHHGSGRARL